MRSPSQLTNLPYASRTPEMDPSLTPSQEPILERDHEATLTLLLAGVVDRRMSIINIQHGPTPADSVGMPVAAWVLGECLLHWALRWRPAEVSFAFIQATAQVTFAALGSAMGTCRGSFCFAALTSAVPDHVCFYD